MFFNVFKKFIHAVLDAPHVTVWFVSLGIVDGKMRLLYTILVTIGNRTAIR